MRSGSSSSKPPVEPVTVASATADGAGESRVGIPACIWSTYLRPWGHPAILHRHYAAMICRSEGKETVLLQLSAPMGANLGIPPVANLAIQDNDPYDAALLDDFEMPPYQFTASPTTVLSNLELTAGSPVALPGRGASEACFRLPAPTPGRSAVAFERRFALGQDWSGNQGLSFRLLQDITPGVRSTSDYSITRRLILGPPAGHSCGAMSLTALSVRRPHKSTGATRSAMARSTASPAGATPSWSTIPTARITLPPTAWATWPSPPAKPMAPYRATMDPASTPPPACSPRISLKLPTGASEARVGPACAAVAGLLEPGYGYRSGRLAAIRRDSAIRSTLARVPDRVFAPSSEPPLSGGNSFGGIYDFGYPVAE